ncbi:hypothetical protein KCU65_g461, partial [Aureobasidium melanogenum]
MLLIRDISAAELILLLTSQLYRIIIDLNFSFRWSVIKEVLEPDSKQFFLGQNYWTAVSSRHAIILESFDDQLCRSTHAARLLSTTGTTILIPVGSSTVVLTPLRTMLMLAVLLDLLMLSRSSVSFPSNFLAFRRRHNSSKSCTQCQTYLRAGHACRSLNSLPVAFYSVILQRRLTLPVWPYISSSHTSPFWLIMLINTEEIAVELRSRNPDSSLPVLSDLFSCSINKHSWVRLDVSDLYEAENATLKVQCSSEATELLSTTFARALKKLGLQHDVVYPLFEAIPSRSQLGGVTWSKLKTPLRIYHLEQRFAHAYRHL